MPIPAFAGSPPHLRSSAPSVDNPSPFACIGVHSRFVPSLWAPVLALRAGCKPSVPPGTPSTNTHPCKAGPVISIRRTFFPPHWERRRCSAPKPGVARFSAQPRVGLGGVQQPQRGCAEATNVWITSHRVGCDIENPWCRCPFLRFRASATNLARWCHGTTPSGLLIFWAFTRGSASAAQPRA